MPVTPQTPGQTPGHEVIYEHERDDRVPAGEHRAERHDDHPISAATLTGGSSLEMIGGGGAVVLAILGLVGFLPFMTAIAAIAIGILALLRVGPAYALAQIAWLAVGGALVLGGSALTARFARQLHAL